MNQNNQNSNWKKLLGFRNMQEKLENVFYQYFSCFVHFRLFITNPTISQQIGGHLVFSYMKCQWVNLLLMVMTKKNYLQLLQVNFYQIFFLQIFEPKFLNLFMLYVRFLEELGFFNAGKFHDFTLEIMVQNLPEKRLGLIKIYLYRSKCLLSKSFITRGQRNVQRPFNEKSKQKTGMWDNWGS